MKTNFLIFFVAAKTIVGLLQKKFREKFNDMVSYDFNEEMCKKLNFQQAKN